MTFFLQMTSLVKPLSPTIEASSCKLHRRQVDSSGVVREVFLQLFKNHPYILKNIYPCIIIQQYQSYTYSCINQQIFENTYLYYNNHHHHINFFLYSQLLTRQ